MTIIGIRTNKEAVNSPGKINRSATSANHGWLKISGETIRAAKYTNAAAQKSFAKSISVAGIELPQTPNAARETIVNELVARTDAIDPTAAINDVVTKTAASKTTDWASDAPASLIKAATTRASGDAAIASQDQLRAIAVRVGPACSCSSVSA